MRILWLTNIPVGRAGELFLGKKTSGLWMDAALEYFQGDEENELFVATTGDTQYTRKAEDGRITYYFLPDKQGYAYKSGKKANIAAMQQMLSEISADIIQIWGTENQTAVDLLEANQDRVPVVAYIQGVIHSLERYFKAGIPTKDIIWCYSPADILTGSGIFQQMKRYRKQALREAEIVKKVKNLIGENDWSRAYYRAILPDVNFYACPLYLNRCFTDYRWELEQVTAHSIMCNSSNYSIKGLHILLEAMQLVKRKYPDVRLFLPGNNPVGRKDLRSRLLQSGYIRYIRGRIKKLDIKENVIFLPFLTPEQMAEKMAKSHVFVVSSSIENHSSSLKEAMLVGVPSIGTYVGGVSEYVRHGENGFMYRFEEPEVLADLVCEIFQSDELAKRLSENARRDMMKLHIERDLHGETIEIYRRIVGARKK